MKSREISSAKLALLRAKIADVIVDIPLGEALLKKIYKFGLTDEYYYQHPLLSGKDKEYVEAVIGIDQNTIMSSTIACSFGAQAQTELGILMNEVSTCMAKITMFEINNDFESLTNVLKLLDIDNFSDKQKTVLFWSKKVKSTIQNYIDAYESASDTVDTLVDSITNKMSDASEYFEKLEYLLTQQKMLSMNIEHHIVAGKLIIERGTDSVLMDQFSKKILDLETFYHVSELSMKQAVLNYQNCVSMVIDSFSLIKTTIPVWKARYSTLLAKWRSKGLSLDTPIENAQDDTFKEAITQNESLVQSLSQSSTVVSGTSNI